VVPFSAAGWRIAICPAKFWISVKMAEAKLQVVLRYVRMKCADGTHHFRILSFASTAFTKSSYLCRRP